MDHRQVCFRIGPHKFSIPNDHHFLISEFPYLPTATWQNITAVAAGITGTKATKEGINGRETPGEIICFKRRLFQAMKSPVL